MAADDEDSANLLEAFLRGAVYWTPKPSGNPRYATVRTGCYPATVSNSTLTGGVGSD